MGLDPLINDRLIEVSWKFEQLILELALVIKYYVQFAFLIVHTVILYFVLVLICFECTCGWGTNFKM